MTEGYEASGFGREMSGGRPINLWMAGGAFQYGRRHLGSSTWKKGGTGLGLAISAALVAAMGSALTAPSGDVAGSTFSFKLARGVAARPPGTQGG
jgi:hypothetical protein